MNKKKASERRRLEEMQHALESLPAGSTTIEERNKLADEAYARDGKQKQRRARNVKVETKDIRALFA